MAEGVEVGTGYITINASALGAVKQVNQQFGGAMPGVGKKAGNNLGVGMAAGMKGALKPLLALFAVAKIGDFFKDANTEARDAEKVGKTTEQRIKTTGGAAKITAKQVEELATAISNKAGMDDEVIQKGANLLLTFKNVRNEAGEGGKIFDRATLSAADLAASGFGSVDSSAKMLGKALNDPEKGLTALGRAGVTFTADQKKQIKELVRTGDVLGAQKLILKEVESQVGGTAEASVTSAEKARVGWDNLKEQIGTALMPVIDKFFSFLTTKGIPALTRLVTFLTNNAGPAFDKVKTFVAPLWAVVKGLFSALTRDGAPAASFIKTKLVPAFMGIVGAGQRLAAVVLPIIKAIIDEFMRNWPVIKPIVMGIFQTVGGIVSDVMGYIKITIQRVTKVVEFIWSRWGDKIIMIVGAAFRTVARVLGGAFKIIGGLVKIVTGILTGDWKKAGEGVKLIIRGLRDIAVGIFKGWMAITHALLGNLVIKMKAKWNEFKDWLGGHLRRGLAAVKEFILAPIRLARDGIGLFLDQMKTKFDKGVDAIGKAWAGLKDKAKAPIKFVIETVLNNGLIAAFNKIAEFVGADKIDDIALPKGFHAGGWTGPGSKFKPAGVVHADEFVVSKAARQAIEAKMPGLLDYMNRNRTVPGFAGGGLVGGSGRFSSLFESRLLQASKMAGAVFRIFQRGFRPATSYSGTSHAGDAVDLAPITTAVLRALRAVGIAAWDRTGKGNWAPHIHGVPTPGAGFAGGSGIWQAQDYLRGGDGLGGRDNGPKVGAIAGLAAFIKAGFNSVKDWLGSLIKGPLGKLSEITGSPFGSLVSKLPKLIADAMLDKVKGFGGGGIAAPGWSMVGESGRELMYTPGSRVYSNRQTEQMVSGRGPTINQYFPTSADPRASAAASSGRIVAALAARGF